MLTTIFILIVVMYSLYVIVVSYHLNLIIKGRKQLKRYIRDLEDTIAIQSINREMLVEEVVYYKQGIDMCYEQNIKLLKLLNKKGVR